MLTLVTGLVLFIGVHSVSIVADGWRGRMVARMGEAGWRGLYSVVALLGLVLIVMGYGSARADPVVLYVPPGWLRYAALVLMLPVFPLLLAAYLPGRIRARAKHPMLAAVKLWSTAHLMSNGTAADVLVFGILLVWAVADRVSLKRRVARAVPGTPPGRFNDVIAVVLGLVLYVAFLAGLHRWLTGMPIVLP